MQDVIAGMSMGRGGELAEKEIKKTGKEEKKTGGERDP